MNGTKTGWHLNPVRAPGITKKPRPAPPRPEAASHRPLGTLCWYDHSHACRKGGHSDRGFPSLAGRSHGDQWGSCRSLRTGDFENSRDTWQQKGVSISRAPALVSHLVCTHDLLL